MKATGKHRLATVVVMIAATWTAAALAQTGAESPEGKIRALEQEQCQAALAGDAKTLKRIFAADYQMVNPAGQLTTREQLLALLTGPTHPYRSATYATDMVRNLGNVMVTIGREDVVPNQGPQAGQLVHRRVTQVWVLQHGTWRLSVRQAMVIPPA
jgi:uncharacterized protein (TIGR02246 family)